MVYWLSLLHKFIQQSLDSCAGLNSCLVGVGDMCLREPLTVVPTSNKAYHLSLVNHPKIQFIITIINDGFNRPMNIACKGFLWSLFLVSS